MTWHSHVQQQTRRILSINQRANQTLYQYVFLTPARIAPSFALRKRFWSSSSRQTAEVLSAQVDPARSGNGSGNVFLEGEIPELVQPINVRQYLREWSVKHQKELENNGPIARAPERAPAVSTSMFVKDKSAEGADTGLETDESLKDEIAAELEEADSADDAGSSDEGRLHIKYDLQPGDVITINHKFARAKMAVYLRRVGHQRQYLLEDGRWIMLSRMMSNSYCVAAYFSPEEVANVVDFLPQEPFLDSLGRDYDAQGTTPSGSVLQMQHKFTVLARDIELAKREYISIADTLFESFGLDNFCNARFLADSVEDTYGVPWTSLTEGAKAVIVEKIHDDDRFCLIRAGLGFSLYTVPRDFEKARASVRAWTRDYQDAAARAAAGFEFAQQLNKNPLTKFIHKARRLIAMSRAFRSPDDKGGVSPTFATHRPDDGSIEYRPTGEEFDEDEKTIIKFLFSTYILHPFAYYEANKRNRACGSLILRAIGAYPTFDLNADTARTLLTEMGCLDPWHARDDYCVQVPLTRLGLNAELKKLTEEMNAATKALDLSDGNIPFVDTMASYRKDWGDLEVFLVDSANAGTIDDGISFEPCAYNPWATWIHVHIAHPSAYLPLDSPFVRHVRYVRETYYGGWNTPDPNLPWEISRNLSLKNDASVLTVSTLLDNNDASVLDTKVQAGTVRNTIRLSPSELKATLGQKYATREGLKIDPLKILPISDKDESSFEHFGERLVPHRHVLQRMYQLSCERQHARLRESPKYLNTYRGVAGADGGYMVRFGPDHKGPDQSWQRVLRSQHVYGDPAVTAGNFTRSDDYYHMRKQDYLNSQELDPIMLVMSIAKESMGRWLDTHNIPALYRCQALNEGDDIDTINSAGPNDPINKPRSFDSTVPGPYLEHNFLRSVPCTSPLRNWSHMRIQYQIDAYLKGTAAAKAGGEAAAAESSTVASAVSSPSNENIDTVKSGNAETNPSVPCLWTAQELADDELESLHSYGAGRSGNSKNIEQHWRFNALHRAFNYGEAQLPAVWDVHISSTQSKTKSKVADTFQLWGFTTGYPLLVDVLPSEEGWEKQTKFRQFLPCKIVRVHPYSFIIQVVPVGPPSDVRQYAFYPELNAPSVPKQDLT